MEQRKQSRPTIPATVSPEETEAAGFIQALSASSERSVRLANLALEMRLHRDEEVMQWLRGQLSPEQLERLEEIAKR